VRETAYEIYYAVSLVLCAGLCGLSAQSLAMSIHMGRIMAIAVINLYYINFRHQFFEVHTYEIYTGKKKSLENSHSRVDVVNVTRFPQYFLRASSSNAAPFQLRTELCSSEFPLPLMPLVRSVGHSDLRRFLRGFRDG